MWSLNGREKGEEHEKEQLKVGSFEVMIASFAIVPARRNE
jgi:hypothetical protein